MKKFVGFILITMLLLSGCSSNYIASIYDNNKEIASLNNSFNIYSKKQSINDQHFIGNVKIEGMDTIWSYAAKENSDIDMTYNLRLVSGKVKLVLISPDNTITTLIECTDQSTLADYATNTLHIKKGKNRIKLVAGKNTELKFDISIPEGKFSELGIN
ncbi:hypothetical protein [Anaerosacchariphilus polymeriproducens]|uniref:Lipoprotein n=1 Tax=Anaerosacchariphilus polymeriproducens TaxID=1812858 RepID=A0A371AUF5_9FIRM|nr:hypothetical protein [Anaerosacchariphilus polymeriproducens]RDU23197.1 hypothetical protein DWV06_10880 [Anaerosacchariphilus polymeriproducens]